ncbi:MAG: hypothetical protein J4400_04205 [Candidatus Aenigmarchaeota archaeon]|nr:hypothetical protein [Candidatus Aenigmarchaeota archaeon]
MIYIGYVYKPSSPELDRIAEIVGCLAEYGTPTRIARIYAALASKAIDDFKKDADQFVREISPYLKVQETGHCGSE